MLQAELSHHLEQQRSGPEPTRNHKNGSSKKSVMAAETKLTLDIPRDRDGSFEPQLIAKYQRRLPGFDDTVVSLFARGQSVREIQGHLAELYGLEVPIDLISTITGEVMVEGHGMAEPAAGGDVSVGILRRVARQDPRRRHGQE